MQKKRLFAFMIIFLFVLSSKVIAQGENPPAIATGAPGQVPGDIIAPATDAQVAAWCHFTKQIVVTHTNVLCVFGGMKAPPPPRIGPAPPSVAAPSAPGLNPS